MAQCPKRSMIFGTLGGPGRAEVMPEMFNVYIKMHLEMEGQVQPGQVWEGQVWGFLRNLRGYMIRTR